jgi:hypothetical protein
VPYATPHTTSSCSITRAIAARAAFAMSLEIFVDCKPAGYAFAGDHERWTEAETFARLAP